MLRRLAPLGLLAACAAEADLRCAAEGAQCADEASLIQLKQVGAQQAEQGKHVAPFAGYGSFGWTAKLSMNCYPGRGADALLGGPFGETPAVGSVSAAAICQAVCDNTEGCEGIVMCTAADGNCGQPQFKKDGTCWLIKNVVPSKCAMNYPGYSTWLSPRAKNLGAELRAANFGSPFATDPEGWCRNSMVALAPGDCRRDYHADWKNFQWICTSPHLTGSRWGVKKDFCDSFCRGCSTVVEGAGTAAPITTPAPKDDGTAKCKQQACSVYDCTLPDHRTCFVYYCGGLFCKGDCSRCSADMYSVAPAGANFR